ncbi:high nitrogen upregulated cytochrome P450 monooxygenase 2 [Mycena belliarum]|uniref:High nitrogen upregulated cytochrome P450 monooxygenase 2 n=1 Tax=Mycena belliarum TaxID=1033014 RepID=A0AAD6UE59_9AGAR|nr:high nitrogen upregulated cytochrome P450 monooxygenase 2 [Mycena belliae]
MSAVLFRDAMLSVVACGLVLQVLHRSNSELYLCEAQTTHFLFNRFEKGSLKLLVRISLLLPSAPAIFLLSHYSSSLRAVFTAYGASYATLALSVICYRLSPLHPLANHPGPLWAKLSKTWSIYQTFSGKNHVTFLNLHRRYGPIVRTGPNELSICDVAAIQPIFGTDGMPKGPMWDGRRSPKSTTYALIAVRNTAIHLRRRKAWNKAFNAVHVKSYEPMLRGRVDQLLNALKIHGKSENLDLAEWFSFFSYDFMGDMAQVPSAPYFGGAFDLMRDGDVNGLWNMLEGGIRVQAYTQHVPWASPLLYSFPGMGRRADKFIKFVVQLAKTRAERGKAMTITDLSSHLLDEGSPSPKPPSFTEYTSDAFLAVLAGSDTTASACATVLSCIFFYILSDHNIFDRLRKEIDDAFSLSDGTTPADDTSKLIALPLLNAIINEALRLQPPVPTGLQRAPEAGTRGKLIGSVFVPEGTSVFVAPYAIHRDPRYFSPDPDRFWPERWLEETHCDPSISVHTDRAAFLPYSIGPMNCAGKLVAQLELRLVVATLVQQLDFALQPGWDHTRWEQGLEDYFVFKKGILPVIVTPRAS